MKHMTLKLVSVLCLTLLLAFAAILAVFHYTMSSHIEATANQAIDYLTHELNNPDLFYTDPKLYDAENTEEEPSLAASCLLVDKQYKVRPYEPEKLCELVQWCKMHPNVGGGTNKVDLGNHQYFVAQIKNITDLKHSRGIWLVYVDVTAENVLIQRIDIYMLVIMAFYAVIACFCGIRIGITMERGQERQKKFFENASHELKTPLMSIQGYAEGIYYGIIPDQKHAVSVIMSETDKMATLVDEILCLSRIESGEANLHLETVSVQEVLNNCLVSLESVIRKKGLQVETHLSEGTIQADAAQLETAVTNLLTNAVKYAESRIVISYDEKTLSIWNHGRELSKEEAVHIFDRFYIGKNGSTGIGLALTKEIIERHGGKIAVENRANGPQFTVHFAKL
jgi:signal transduction histidine kinase